MTGDFRLLTAGLAVWAGAGIGARLAPPAVGVSVGAICLALVIGAWWAKRKGRTTHAPAHTALALLLSAGCGYSCGTIYATSTAAPHGVGVLTATVISHPGHTVRASDFIWKPGGYTTRSQQPARTVRASICLSEPIPRYTTVTMHGVLTSGRYGCTYSFRGRIVSSHTPTGLAAYAQTATQRFATAVESLPAAELATGIIYGDDHAFSATDSLAFRHASLTHLTAVSGSHVAIVLACIGLCVPRKRRALRALTSLAGMWTLLTIVGPEASVQRALLMALAVSIALWLRRPSYGLPLIGLALITMGTQRPDIAHSLGFELSALATTAIIAIANPLARRLSPHIGTAPATLIVIPTVAGAACAPVIATLNPALSPWAVAANIAAAPLVTPITVIGLLAVLAAPILPSLTTLAAYPISAGAWWIRTVGRITDTLPGITHPLLATLLSIALSTLTILLLTLTRITMNRYRHDRRHGRPRTDAFPFAQLRTLPARAQALRFPRSLLLPIAGLLAAATFAISAVIHFLPHPGINWTYRQCDVGQGSAFLARLNSHTYLVDVGSAGAGILHCLNDSGVHHIDTLILSHDDEDHSGALAEVLEHVSVGEIWVSGAYLDTLTMSARTRSALAGRRFEFVYAPLSTPDLTVHWPRPEARGDDNDVSIVVEFHGHPSAIVMGDLPEHYQDVLAATGDLHPVDIAVVAHHGSASQSPRLAEILHAPIAIMSCGAHNTYGHPTRRALDIYGRWGTVLTTPECGSMSFNAEEIDAHCR